MAHVLLIDDDRVIGELLASVLDDAGHTSEVATSVDAAAPARRPDLVIADLVGIGHYEADAARALVADVRRRFDRVPVVVCTAHRAAESDDVGADAVVAKPFELDLLIATVERLSGERR